MRALQRALVSVIITLLNDSERSLNKKWLHPVTNKSNPPLVRNQSDTPSYPQFSYFDTKKHTLSSRKSNLKILRAYSLTKTNYWFGSYLGFSGDTPIDLNRERLQAPWQALAFREKALDSTPNARIVEQASALAKTTQIKRARAQSFVDDLQI